MKKSLPFRIIYYVNNYLLSICLLSCIVLLFFLILMVVYPGHYSLSFDPNYGMTHKITSCIPLLLITIGSYYSFLALDAIRTGRYIAGELSRQLNIAWPLLVISGLINIFLSIDLNGLKKLLTGKLPAFNPELVFQLPLYGLLVLALGLYYKHLGKGFSPHFH